MATNNGRQRANGQLNDVLSMDEKIDAMPDFGVVATHARVALFRTYYRNYLSDAYGPEACTNDEYERAMTLCRDRTVAGLNRALSEFASPDQSDSGRVKARRAANAWKDYAKANLLPLQTWDDSVVFELYDHFVKDDVTLDQAREKLKQDAHNCGMGWTNILRASVEDYAQADADDFPAVPARLY